MIVLAAIGLYFLVALPVATLLGRRLKRQRTPAPRPQIESVGERRLDINPALRRSR